MKKRLLAVIFVLAFAVSFNGCMLLDKGMIDNAMKVTKMVGGGEKKGGAAFDIEKTTLRFNQTLWGATKLTAEGVKELYMAIGKKEEAVKMEQFLKKLAEAKEKDDQDAFKEILPQLTNAVAELKSLELEKEAKGKDAQKHVGKAFLQTSVAVIMDKKAIDIAKLLVSKLPGEIKSNPLKATKLLSVLNMAKFTVSTVPKQLSNLGSIVTNVAKYASTNGMATPSASEKEKTERENGPPESNSDIL